MSGTMVVLSRQIGSATDLQSVVRTMKAVAASSISQYERSVRAMSDFHRTIEFGLGAYLRGEGSSEAKLGPHGREEAGPIGAIVLGSDQGLVGRFNEAVVEHAVKALAGMRGQPRVWAVGERVHARLSDAGVPPQGLFAVPTAITAITPLIERIQRETCIYRDDDKEARFYVFYNQPGAGGQYEPVSRRLLPFDAVWRQGLIGIPWPTRNPPEVLRAGTATPLALIRAYLFSSLYRACAGSLASENASRLAAMERAERNIKELLEDIRSAFHRLRQDAIDSELFDVISGFEALGGSRRYITGDGHGRRQPAERET